MERVKMTGLFPPAIIGQFTGILSLLKGVCQISGPPQIFDLNHAYFPETNHRESQPYFLQAVMAWCGFFLWSALCS